MISKIRYRCASANDPSEATLVCNQEGCQSHAFLCGRNGCDCMARHRKHQCKLLDGLVQELASQLVIPEELAKQEKDIDALIGSLIKDLELLKTRHREHVEKHAKKLKQSGGLLSRLIEGEPLLSCESTGDSMSKVITKANEFRESEPPYKLTDEPFKKELNELRTQVSHLLARLEELWRVEKAQQQFMFSAKLKHEDVTISEDSTNLNTSCGLLGPLRLALVQPALRLDTSSRISFNITKFSGCVVVGASLSSIVAVNDFNFNTTNDKENSHGTFSLMWNGRSFTQGKLLEETECVFKGGDLVVVEWNPENLEVSYQVLGTERKHTQSVPKELLELGPLHFTVGARGTCDAGLLA